MKVLTECLFNAAFERLAQPPRCFSILCVYLIFSVVNVCGQQGARMV